MSVYLFIYFCIQQWENIFIFLLVLSNHFLHRSGCWLAKLACDDFCSVLGASQSSGIRQEKTHKGFAGKKRTPSSFEASLCNQLLPPITLGHRSGVLVYCTPAAALPRLVVPPQMERACPATPSPRPALALSCL